MKNKGDIYTCSCESQKLQIARLSAVNEELAKAAQKVVSHYEFVHRGMPVSTGVYLIGKLEEALKLADEMGEK